MDKTLKTISTFVGIGVIVCGVAGAWAVAQHQIGDLRTDLNKVVEKQDADHDAITEIRSDVKWIRQAMERAGQ